ncbi:DUF6314 family protein [Paracoccus aestuariivivens]|uniref:DUF6314 domain-containing protein n=1 Tax=Paracoccus aestuariivivens TaxID=1820333 RepID=A0A6L6J8P1_9RHOB|nr:DUF6314 family protein [Paracoccus aestuariivivens]MTH76381.1 hypothetical protein [Paracoccus aestuariivivens]
MKDLDQTIGILDFLGSWKVKRRIDDAKTGWVTRFEGLAVITQDLFHEDGFIRLQRQTLPSQRSYRLDWGNASVDVRRPSGAPFITLQTAGVQKVQHLCGDDLYRGLFLFSDKNRWAEAWVVEGPRKKYRSFSHYWRA